MAHLSFSSPAPQPEATPSLPTVPSTVPGLLANRLWGCGVASVPPSAPARTSPEKDAVPAGGASLGFPHRKASWGLCPGSTSFLAPLLCGTLCPAFSGACAPLPSGVTGPPGLCRLGPPSSEWDTEMVLQLPLCPSLHGTQRLPVPPPPTRARAHTPCTHTHPPARFSPAALPQALTRDLTWPGCTGTASPLCLK